MRRGVWLGVLLFFLGGHCSSADHSLMPYKIKHINGVEVDWLSGQAVALGRVRVLYDIKRKINYRRQLKQQGRDVARDMLIEALTEVAIGDERRVADMPELLPVVKEILDASPAEVVPSERSKQFIVSLDAWLWGERGLAGLVILADRPADEEREAATVAHASEEPSPPGTVEGAPAEDEPTIAAVSGLIVDATGISDASPALFARILDEDGRVIYGPEIAEPRFVAERGMISYALLNPSGEPLLRGWIREGASPMTVQAIAAAGPAKTDLVVSLSDGERIRMAAEDGAFLEECNVIALMAPPIQKTAPAKARRIPPNRQQQVPPKRKPH